MYLLLKETRVNAFSQPVYLKEVKSESLEEIANEIIKRVSDGCPLYKLTVVEEVDFEMTCRVEYKNKELEV